MYSQLRRLASSQKHPKDATIAMFWTVAYDWRRDFYEQVGGYSVSIDTCDSSAHSVCSCSHEQIA